MQDYEKPKTNKILVIIVTAVISIAVTFFACLGVGAFLFKQLTPAKTPLSDKTVLYVGDEEENLQALEKLNEMIDVIRDNYYVEISDREIIESLIENLPAGLESPYSYYLTAEQNAEIEESMSGQYVGIGCTVTLTENFECEIVEVYEGGPAFKADLQTGDLIIAVDGENMIGVQDVSTVAAKVKGEEDTEVELTIYRPVETRTFDIKITRKTIHVENIKYRMLNDAIGYLQIKSFAGGVSDDFASSMDDLQAQGATKVVFDLRMNSGGSAGEMLNMLDYLLPEGKIIATIEGRENGKALSYTWKAKTSMSVPEDMTYAILLNNYSASASELFSGALRDHGKAILIGEQTFGKGSGTTTYPFDDGSALNLTIFEYILPGDDKVEGLGLTPDIAEVLADELKFQSVETLTPEEDTVLARAILELSKK